MRCAEQRDPIGKPRVRRKKVDEELRFEGLGRAAELARDLSNALRSSLINAWRVMPKIRPKVSTFLNNHFRLLAACVEAEGGTIDKYIGNSLMAFWGAPELQPDHSARACRAASAMAAAIVDDNRRRRGFGLPPVSIRIGLHAAPQWWETSGSGTYQLYAGRRCREHGTTHRGCRQRVHDRWR